MPKADGLHIKYDKNGDIKSKIHYKNGKKHGPYETYSRGGCLETGSYKDGEKHGKSESYYKNGKLSTKKPIKTGNYTANMYCI